MSKQNAIISNIDCTIKIFRYCHDKDYIWYRYNFEDGTQVGFRYNIKYKKNDFANPEIEKNPTHIEVKESMGVMPDGEDVWLTLLDFSAKERPNTIAQAKKAVSGILNTQEKEIFCTRHMYAFFSEETEEDCFIANEESTSILYPEKVKLN